MIQQFIVDGEVTAQARGERLDDARVEFLPAPLARSASASWGPKAPRYGRTLVRASYVSQTRMTRAPSGIVSPRRPCG